MESIRDAWGFSGKTPITLSRGFSVEILIGVTLLWKTKLNRSISTVEDGIPRWLQHCHKTCCEKGGCCGRWACMIWRWFHYKDIISGQVDLHMTKKRIGRREWYKMVSILISEQSRITIHYHLSQILSRILEPRRYLQSWI